MKTDTNASDLERRKYVRLRVRGDIQYTPQKYEGRTYFVVKDPVSLRYYRFKDQEYFLIRLMDGKHTLDQAQKEFEKRYRPDRLTLEDLEQFGQQLLTAGLAQNETPGAGKQLYERKRKRDNSKIWQTVTNLLYIKLPVFDPDRLLTKMLPYCSFIFSLWFFALSVLFMLSAIGLVATHFDTFYAKLPTYQQFFSFQSVIYMWAALGVVKVIHEFGHGLSCKTFGGEVHEMGFLLLCLSPAMYCNVSDAWTLPSKWKRIIISFAGIYVELMIAALATFVWWNSHGAPFVHNMALSLMIVCSVSTVVFNGNPLMRYDGYYVLADWLEIPNLRDRANRYIQRLAMEHCLGMDLLPEPYMQLGRRILFVIYAVVSYVYRWVVTFFILNFFSSFLRPYKLEVVGQFMAMFALGSMIGWPLYNLGKNYYKRGWRLPDMSTLRVAVSASILAALILVFFLVPLPVSRIRENGLVAVQAAYHMPVHIELDGKLEKILVTEGEWVSKGDPLATFSSLDLTEQATEARLEYEGQVYNVQSLGGQLRMLKEPAQNQRLQLSLSDAEAERDRAWVRWNQLRKQIKERLTLKAPCAGVVMGLPSKEDEGKFWDKSRGEPFCTVGDPNKLRVLVPLTAADYDLLRENLKRFRQRAQELPVTIRVRGLDARLWTGKVTHLPEAEAKEIPLGLSTKGGGPLALKPTSDANHPQPLDQVFLVGIDFDRPDAAITPGCLAQVKVHNEYRSCAWWAWRTISLTFDLGLM